jgi:hypothetical protein
MVIKKNISKSKLNVYRILKLGIVGNEFYDPVYNEKINLLSDKGGSDVKWWNGSAPIWSTARSKVCL